MARVDSYPKSDARKILREHFREIKEYKNDVDRTRSAQNYHFGTASNAKECMEQIQKRVNEIMSGRNVQTQTNIMSSWIVSLPAELPEKYQNDFFSSIYGFFENRYGKDNILDGFVHLDETTPHVHVCFVPESISRKTGKQTVSSASLLTRNELHNCQADLEAFCRKRYGLKNLILNGRIKGGVSLEKLKAETAIQTAKEQEKHALEQLEVIQDKIAVLERKQYAIKQQNTDLKIENDDLKQEIERNRKLVLDMTENEILHKIGRASCRERV